MKPTSDFRRGLFLIVFGALLVGVVFGASWALAPNTSVTTPDSNATTTTLVGVQGPGWGGSVVELDSNGTRMWRIGNAISYQDVSMLDNGTVLATHADGNYQRCGQFPAPCKRTGVRFIDPAGNPNIVGEWSYPVRTRKDSEVHDAEMVPSGELLVADMEYESIYTYNFSTGNRSWTWNASQYYNEPRDPTRTDWLHINDVDRIGDGRYLVSVRNTNQLLVIERGEGVVEVINKDRDPSVLNKQHNPHWLGDGAVLVADSENHRVVELHRNESSGEWEEAWIVYEAGGIHFDWPRDADRLPNGNTLITDSRNNRVVEITRNGSVVTSYTVPDLPYEADRVPFGESHGRPYETAGEYDVFGDRSTEIPILSALLTGARHSVALPFWVSELHVLVVLVAVILWGVGGALLVKSRWTS
ncbi:aryl-sulfate sulfotransferase [Haladaptatus pallidirubidus]|uniref:Arylsulfotransferase (ASST) n=1 Tax=Haladaptatus pallidirubidus TaxID=1008152 RepID=A0AAV3UDZ2_9EURY|nr:aryl-sulfate sulfotransferase [Haladaptatus pallidirubidus]